MTDAIQTIHEFDFGAEVVVKNRMARYSAPLLVESGHLRDVPIHELGIFGLGKTRPLNVRFDTVARCVIIMNDDFGAISVHRGVDPVTINVPQQVCTHIAALQPEYTWYCCSGDWLATNVNRCYFPETQSFNPPETTALMKDHIKAMVDRLRKRTAAVRYLIWAKQSRIPEMRQKGGLLYTAYSASTHENESDQFLEEVYRLGQENLEKATDKIFDHIDRLLRDGDEERVDRLLSKIEVDRLPTALMRSFLTITAPAKAKLSSRKALYERIEQKMIELKGNQHTKKLIGRLN